MNLKNFPLRLDSKTSSLRITVPENLDLALEGLIRKVLKEQPKIDDIYSFAADYFETLLKIRDKADLKFTAAQLCPFHNDEDAHEMIKLARTFTKEKQKTKSEQSAQPKIKKTEKKETDGKVPAKKGVRIPKPNETSKDKKPAVESKQTTSDLTKKLPLVTKPLKTQKSKGESEAKLEVEEKKNVSLTSDPIKELVEKELMMKANSSDSKTEKTAKTAANNDSESKTVQKTKKKDSSDSATNESVTKETATDKDRSVEDKNEEKTDKIEEAKDEENKKTSLLVHGEKSEDTENANEKRTEDLEAADKGKIENLKGEKTKKMTKTNQKSTANTAKEHEENIKMEKTNKESTKDRSDKVTLKPEKESIPTEIQQPDEKGKKENKIRKNSTENEENIETKSATANLNQTTGDISSAVREKSEKTPAETSPTKTTKKTPTEAEIDDSTTSSQQSIEYEHTESVLKPDKQETSKPTRTSENTAEEITLVGATDTMPVDTVKAETDEGQDKKIEENSVNTAVKSETNNKESNIDHKKNEKMDNNSEGPEEETKSLGIISVSEKQPEISEKSVENSSPEGPQKVPDNEKPAELSEKKEKQTMCEDIKTLDLKLDDKIVKEETKTEEVNSSSVEETKTNKNVADSKLVPESSADANNKEKVKESETIPILLPKEPEGLEQQPGKPEKQKTIEGENSSDKIIKMEYEADIHVDNSQLLQNAKREGPQGESEAETMKDDQTVSLDTAEFQSSSVEVKENKNERGEELCGVVGVQKIPKEKPEEEKKENAENIQVKDVKTELAEVPKDNIQTKEDSANTEELCLVVEAQQIPKKEETEGEITEKVLIAEAETAQIKESKTETIAENQSSPEKDKTDVEKSATEPQPEISDIKNAEELCTVVDVEHLPKEDKAVNAEPTAELRTEPKTEDTENKENRTKSELPATADAVVRVEQVQNTGEISEMAQQAGEIQIKTIQTHLYDSIQVPETMTKEYRVHSVAVGTTAKFPDVASLDHQGYNPVEQWSNTTRQIEEIVDENMNSTAELVKTISTSSSPERMTKPADTPPPTDIVKIVTSPLANVPNQQNLDDSDDLLDIMTPTSDYSLNLSELSWQTLSGLFLDSEKRYSSLEKEEPRYATSRTDHATKEEKRLEVQELIEKTVLRSRVEAVPDSFRDLQEMRQEANLIMEEKIDECEIRKADEREHSGSESSEGSRDNDLPVVTVEVKTVIESQVLEEEEKDGRLPDVEVQIQATIDIQQADLKESSDGESQQKLDAQSSLEEYQSTRQDERTKESSSTKQTTGRESSSGETDSTISSGATEIKRADYAKKNLSSSRNLLSTQSLDFGKKNPLTKTQSLTTFRHGVTDFEVWNRIEKELEEAATKIQSKYRGYKTRKKLQRENAVQITTEESSTSTTPVEAEAKDECQQQSTGEFHDSIVLSEHPR